jgi:hypothetical protein
MRSASRHRTGLVPQPARPSRRDLPAGSSRRRNVGLGPRSSHQPAPPHPGVRRGCDGHSGPADLRARFGIEPGPLVTPPRGRVRWWATLAPQRLQTCRGREATSMRLACGHPQEACKTGGARPERLGLRATACHEERGPEPGWSCPTGSAAAAGRARAQAITLDRPASGHEHELAAGPGAFLRAGVRPAADCPGKAAGCTLAWPVSRLMIHPLGRGGHRSLPFFRPGGCRGSSMILHP